MEHINYNKDNIVVAIITMPVRCIFVGRRHIARMERLGAAVCGKDPCICPLKKVRYGGSILVTVDAYVPAGLDCKHAHPSLPTTHSFDFRPEIDDLALARL